MVRIDPNNRITVPTTPRAAGSTAPGARFDIKAPSGQAEARAPVAAPLGAAASVESLLALQGVEERPSRRRRLIRRGGQLVDALDAMKVSLLSGPVSPGLLDEMMAVLAQPRDRGEGGLDAVLDEVELRVRVELAKLGRFDS